jgi:hypothetical protein
VAFVGKKMNVYRVLEGKPEGRNYLEDLDVDRWTMFNSILQYRPIERKLGSAGTGSEQVASTCKYRNKPWGST